MRALILSSLFAVGLGLAGATSASATPISAINSAVAGQNMVDQTQYYYGPRRARCRTVQVCRMTPWGRRCHWERVCRRGW